MKLAARAAAAFCARPDPTVPAVLIYGSDAMRVALRRQELVAALVGPTGEAEMRLTRLSPADLKEGAGRLSDAMKAMGFFPGIRAVVLEGAGEAQTASIEHALGDWCDSDARLVVTAGTLAARSSLRKFFERHPTAQAIVIYDDPPDREEIERLISGIGIDVPRDAADALYHLGQTLEPGDFRQTLDKIALYKIGDDAPLTSDEIAALAPATSEAAVDDAINAAADADVGRLGPLMRRIEAQGTTPVTICITAARHFRVLLAAAADPAGPEAALGRMRPPVFGPRRDRMRRQATHWGAARLDGAVRLLVDTDLTLRSASTAPAMAVVERALIRLAMMARR